MEPFPGEFWIATRNGMYGYDVAANKISEKPVLPDVTVRSIFRAKDSSLWIGTYGNGFFKYENGQFIAMPLDPKKYLATAHTFLEDGLGFFWITTNHGLFKIRKQDLDNAARGSAGNAVFYYYYDKSSGFNTNEFNGGCEPAALMGEKARFYFPSLNGIVYFNPDSARSEFPANPVFIDNITVDSAGHCNRNAIRIDPGFNRLAIDVSTAFYGLEDNLRLEYKLEPGSDTWNPVARDGKIIINQLLPGNYQLAIRNRNGWGPDEISRAAVSFEVLPHWYNTKLFTALLTVLVIGFLFLLLRIRTRILRTQNARLQMKVDERTLELQQSSMLKEKLISVIMHDLRSPLFSQSLLISHLEENYYRMEPAQVQEILGYLKDGSNKICQFSTDFLTWYNSHTRGFIIRNEQIELEGFARETGDFYADIARRKGLSIEYAIPDGLVFFSDRNILSIIMRNLVDNAVKYTNSGTVIIMAERTEDDLRIKISDTGKGMPAEKIGEILSYSEESKVRTTATFGYRFITELIRKLGGELSIESEPGKGTLVMVSLRT
jgi:signal transduction histidine kinase